MEREESSLRVLVTGGTGFIGAHLVRRLLADGHQVDALVRDRKKAALVLPRYDDNLTFINGDLSFFKQKDLKLEPYDVVVHLAAVITAKTAEEYHRTNCDAVREMLACIERQSWQPRRFLFASSLAAGGPCQRGKPLSEDDPLRPIDPYGKAKAEAEAIVSEAPFPTTSFRPPITIGSGDENFFTVFRAAKYRLGARIGGNQVLSWIDIHDLVEAIVLMMNEGYEKSGDEEEDARKKHKIYYVSAKEDTDINSIFKTMAAVMQRRVFVIPVPIWLVWLAMVFLTIISWILPFINNQLDYKQYKQVTSPAFQCTSKRLQRDLKWQPKYDLRMSIAAAVKGYKELGWL